MALRLSAPLCRFQLWAPRGSSRATAPPWAPSFPCSARPNTDWLGAKWCVSWTTTALTGRGRRTVNVSRNRKPLLREWRPLQWWAAAFMSLIVCKWKVFVCKWNASEVFAAAANPQNVCQFIVYSLLYSCDKIFCWIHSVQGQWFVKTVEVLYHCTNIWWSKSKKVCEKVICSLRERLRKESCLLCSTGEKRKRIVCFFFQNQSSKVKRDFHSQKWKLLHQNRLMCLFLILQDDVWIAWCISW